MNTITTHLSSSMPQSALGFKINEYGQWREKLIGIVHEYESWLNQADLVEPGQQQRLKDIQDVLKNDQLVLAFLAEFSRGKTETINALFFADFNQRLLPSEPGRTTMCPTEIFWDSNDDPCIKLLPMDTRHSNETVSAMKSKPGLWKKLPMDVTSPDAMKESLKALVATQSVNLKTAKDLGFWDESDVTMQRSLSENGTVDIPQWRHALINYPHPMLKDGLIVIDTPGLNTMGAEPELTLGIIPNAHAVLFLTATDTGVTKSDMNMWNEYVNQHAQHQLVLLNKIDTLWDGLETEDEVNALIQKQVTSTAVELGVDEENVFPISAQKALIAKIKNDEALLAKSGFEALESALANQLIEAKHSVLGRAIISECSNMIRGSRKISQMRLTNIKDQIAELRELQDQNRDRSRDILANVVAERKRYEDSVATYNEGCDKIKRIGNKLLRHLSISHLNSILDDTKQEIGESLTTIGLNRNMRALTGLASDLAQDITEEAAIIKDSADNLYQLFWSKHGFEKTEAKELDMSNFLNKMKDLEAQTDQFCRS